MRMWHTELLPYLPKAQFKGQLRELVAIMHDWRDKGKTNHLLINRVMNYPKVELYVYFRRYFALYQIRGYGNINEKIEFEFDDFVDDWDQLLDGPIYQYWHDNTYLKICMANLYEKYLATGKSKITEEEWRILLDGYKKITGTNYVI